MAKRLPAGENRKARHRQPVGEFVDVSEQLFRWRMRDPHFIGFALQAAQIAPGRDVEIDDLGQTVLGDLVEIAEEFLHRTTGFEFVAITAHSVGKYTAGTVKPARLEAKKRIPVMFDSELRCPGFIAPGIFM